MRIILTIMVLMHFSGGHAQKQSGGSLFPACKNFIEIKGETNINNFFLNQVIPENEICGPGEAGWIHLPGSTSFEILIPVKNFSASNHFVYQDFLELVKASRYPFIKIQINNTQFREFYSPKPEYETNILISIAGVTRSIAVECYILECSYGEKIISGTKNLKLTDFKLVPPEKSFGLIKVKNELNINFEFKMPEDLLTNVSEN